jgi:hypothetical protein
MRNQKDVQRWISGVWKLAFLCAWIPSSVFAQAGGPAEAPSVVRATVPDDVETMVPFATLPNAY